MPVDVDREGVRLLLTRNAQLVEVLDEQEYRNEHLPGALNIPLRRLSTEAVVRLRRDRPVVVYCWDWLCDLSPRAAHRLESLGFEDVYDYAAGKLDWIAAGEPVEGSGVGLTRLRELVGGDVPRCRLHETAAEAVARADDWDVLAVVDEDDVVLGLLRVEDVDAEDRRLVSELMHEGPPTWRGHMSVAELAHHLHHQPTARLVVTRPDGRLLGVVSPDEVLSTAKDEEGDPG